MTWNAAGILCSGRELILLHLLEMHTIDVMVLTQAELTVFRTEEFMVDGYTSYLSHPLLSLMVASAGSSCSSGRCSRRQHRPGRTSCCQRSRVSGSSSGGSTL
jgi:hypothetical protein